MQKNRKEQNMSMWEVNSFRVVEFLLGQGCIPILTKELCSTHLFEIKHKNKYLGIYLLNMLYPFS